MVNGRPVWSTLGHSEQGMTCTTFRRLCVGRGPFTCTCALRGDIVGVWALVTLVGRQCLVFRSHSHGRAGADRLSLAYKPDLWCNVSYIYLQRWIIENVASNIRLEILLTWKGEAKCIFKLNWDLKTNCFQKNTEIFVHWPMPKQHSQAHPRLRLELCFFSRKPNMPLCFFMYFMFWF